jgi:acyl carrier protein
VTEEQCLQKLTPVFREVFRDESLIVTPPMTAKDVERWDSLSHTDMIILVEETFGVRIPTREVTRMENVGDLVRVLMALSK